MPSRPEPGPVRALEFVPVGPLPAPLAERLVIEASRGLSLPCRLGSMPLDPPPLDGRDQLDADALLAALESSPIAPGVVRVGLAAGDLGTPLFTFVFGRARRGGRAAVVSLARLDPSFNGRRPDPRGMVRRAVREIYHELGHVLGLLHCPDLGCVMHFAASVETIDLRGGGLCPDCGGRLGAGQPFRTSPAPRAL